MTRLTRLASAAGLSIALVGPARAEEVAPSARSADAFRPSSTRVALSLGFSHWFGKTFGGPDGFKTPSVSIGIRPRRSWVEIETRYVVTVVPLPLPSGRTGTVGFLSIGALGSRELGLGRQSINVFAGPEVTLAHTNDGIGWGVGLVLGVQWLMRTGWAHKHSMGGFVSTHAVVYALAGDHSIFKDPRRDAQVDLGVVTTLF